MEKVLIKEALRPRAWVGKGTVKRATKTCNLFCSIASKRVKKRCCAFYYPHAANQVVAGCEKLLQKVESSSTFCNKTCTCCVFYRPDCFAASDVTPVYGVNSRVLLSNQKSVFTQLAANFVCCKTGLNVGGKTCNIAFQLVFQQCCKTSCTFSLPLLPYL